jgi:hypothetical protein
MSAAGLRALGAAIARLELRQVELLAAVERIEARLAPAPEVDDLVAALAEFFGSASFTAGAILIACEDDPRGRLAAAVGAVVDFNQPPHNRSVQLGRLLARLPGLQRVGGRRGAALWRVA